MTILFVDASAVVAMMTREPEDDTLARRLGTAQRRLFSPVAFWETVVAVARKRKISIEEARSAVHSFLAEFGFSMVLVTDETAAIALTAWEQYGKASRHPAELNMGDCFAYACARINGADLLYKGDDFIHTDLA